MEKRSNAKSNPAQSVFNNLNCIRDNKYNADEAKFYLSRLKTLMGRTEQSLIIQLVLGGFESCPEIDRYRDALKQEWNNLKK